MLPDRSVLPVSVVQLVLYQQTTTGILWFIQEDSHSPTECSCSAPKVDAADAHEETKRREVETDQIIYYRGRICVSLILSRSRLASVSKYL